MGDAADLLAQFHFLVAQLTGFCVVLLPHSVLFLLLHLAQLLIKLLRRRRKLGVEKTNAAAGLIDQIDGLIGKETVGDVAVPKGGGGDESFIGNLEAMVGLITLAQPSEDFDGVLDRWLTHVHRLEASLQGRIPFDVFAVLIECGSADALQFAAGKGWLEDVGGIDGTLGSAGADEGVHLINDKDHVGRTTDLVHDLFEALLEFTAVLGACHQQTDVQGEDALVLKDVWNLALVDALGEPFGQGGLADAGFTDEDGVVLGPAAQDLNDPVDFVLSAHHRIKLAFGGELGQVAAEFIQGRGLGGAFAATSAGDFGGLAEHADDLSADLGQVDTEVFQHASGHTLAFTDQAQEQVLSADVVVAQLTGLL